MLANLNLIPPHVVTPGHLHPVAGVGLDGVGGVGVEGGVAGVLADTGAARRSNFTASLNTLTARF